MKSRNAAATTPEGMGAINKTMGPNPTTLANATGQAQSCRRRIPIPVPKAMIEAKPLRKAGPAESTSGHWPREDKLESRTMEGLLWGPGSSSTAADREIGGCHGDRAHHENEEAEVEGGDPERPLRIRASIGEGDARFLDIPGAVG